MMKKTSLLSILTLAIPILSLPSIAISETVNIYSYRQPELIEPITKAFTEETGIDVNIAFIKKGLVERLKAESIGSPADIVLTVDSARLELLDEEDLTQPIESDIINANIPERFRDPDNHWFGVTQRARIIYASKDRVKEESITYDELADPKWKGRICIRPGTHAYNLALISAMIHYNGIEKTEAWLEGVKANLARKPQGNDRAQVKAIWAGECDIAIGNTYYMGKMLADDEQKEWANSVRLVFPTFEAGDGGTQVDISGVAMTKNAPHPKEALAFIEFLSSSKAQSIYAEKNYEYPLLASAKVSPVVASWGELTPDNTSLMELASNRADALRLVEKVGFDE